MSKPSKQDWTARGASHSPQQWLPAETQRELIDWQITFQWTLRMVWMPIDCWLTEHTYTIIYNHNQSWHTLTSHVIPIPNEGPLNERPACLSRMTSSAFARMAISTRSWPTVLPSTDPCQKQVKQHAKTPGFCWQILQARSFVSRLQEFSCLKPHSSNSIALTPNYRNTEYSSEPKRTGQSFSNGLESSLHFLSHFRPLLRTRP